MTFVINIKILTMTHQEIQMTSMQPLHCSQRTVRKPERYCDSNCDQICKKSLIHAYSFSTLKLCKSACVWPITSKYGSKTFLSLHLNDRIFQLNSSLINKVMPLQSCKIRCVYKTPFCKSGHNYWYIVLIINLSTKN